MKINQCILCKDMVVFYNESHTEHINEASLCEQCAEFLLGRRSDTFNNIWALEG